jgi:hypothetical protein
MTPANVPMKKETGHDPGAFLSAVAGILSRDLADWWGGQETTSRYVLIDGALCPEGWIEAWCRERQLDAEPLFLRMPEAESHALGPYFVEIPRTALGASHPLVRSLAEGPGVWQALTVMASPVPIMKLHAHLRGFLDGVLEDETNVLLRWYDARVGIPLLNLLPEAARAAFLQPFAYWKSWDWHYRPAGIAGPEKPGLPEFVTPAPIDEALLKALGGLNVVQNLIAHLEEENPVPEIPPLPMCPALKHHIAERELQQAWDLGLAKSFRNQRAVVWFALHIHPDVWRHAYMRESAQKRFARRGVMNWLYEERASRPQGERALREQARVFLEALETERDTRTKEPNVTPRPLYRERV